MKRVPCWPWTNRAYVCIAVYALEFEGVIGVLCNVMPPSCTRCSNALQSRCWSSFVECMGYCGVDFRQTARTFVLQPACSNLKVSLVFHAVWGRTLMPMRHFAVQMYYNGDALIFVCWMMKRRRVGPGRTVCTFVLLFVCWRFDTVWGRNLTLMCCPNTLQFNCVDFQ